MHVALQQPSQPRGELLAATLHVRAERCPQSRADQVACVPITFPGVYVGRTENVDSTPLLHLSSIREPCALHWREGEPVCLSFHDLHVLSSLVLFSGASRLIFTRSFRLGHMEHRGFTWDLRAYCFLCFVFFINFLYPSFGENCAQSSPFGSVIRSRG
jgi:hypothetical protein